jgi:hypothetical protein
VSLHLYAENNDGDIVEVPGKLREDTLEVVQQAAEGAVGESTIVLDDPNGEFYMRGHKPLYLIETEATGDEWLGVIGVFFSWNRRFRRGNYRTDAGREVHISVKDVNTLWTRRVQKGTDAERPQETDVERITDWAINTPEFVGGFGSSGFAVEDRAYVFTDSPYQMDKTDYTSQDSAGVVNDALQDSGKNAFLYPSPITGEIVRVGMWYGRTEREDFSSLHRISNILSDISPETLDAEWLFEPTVDYDYDSFTFALSLDAELDRDPSRVASGVMVMADGGYGYVTRPETLEAFAPRDMVMQAELVKTVAQAIRRATRYVRDLRNEDDAITTAVIVPSALVNAFVQGQRVQFRCSYMPGYAEDFVWLRIASRTVRQLSADSGLYEIALDLRAEEPPDSATTGTGAACTGQTATGSFHPIGGAVDTPNASDGHVYYWNPGEPRPITVAEMTGEVGHWNFPAYGSGGAATTDYAGDCAQNRVRCMVEGSGTMTIHTAEYSGNARTLKATLFHHRYGEGEEGDPTSGVDILDETQIGAAGSDFEFTITTHDSQYCTHWVDVTDIGGVCGQKWGFGGFDWVAS